MDRKWTWASCGLLGCHERLNGAGLANSETEKRGGRERECECECVCILLPLPTAAAIWEESSQLTPYRTFITPRGGDLTKAGGRGRGGDGSGMGNGRGRTLRFHSGHFEQDQVGGREKKPRLPAEAEQWSPTPTQGLTLMSSDGTNW